MNIKANKISMKFRVLALLSILTAIIQMRIYPGDIQAVNFGYLVGSYIGAAFSLFFFPLAVAEILTFIVNIFVKEKKKFISSILIWVGFSFCAFVVIKGASSREARLYFRTKVSIFTGMPR